MNSSHGYIWTKKEKIHENVYMGRSGCSGTFMDGPTGIAILNPQPPCIGSVANFKKGVLVDPL